MAKIKYLKAYDFLTEKSFVNIFNEYFRTLCFFVNKYVNDIEVSKDLVQDIFVKLWNKRFDFETDLKVKAFLYISAKNASLNYVRSLKVRINSAPDIIQKENRNSDYKTLEGKVLKDMIHSEFIKGIYKEIELLPPKRKEVFKLAYIEGLKNH